MSQRRRWLWAFGGLGHGTSPGGWVVGNVATDFAVVHSTREFGGHLYGSVHWPKRTLASLVCVVTLTGRLGVGGDLKAPTGCGFSSWAESVFPPLNWLRVLTALQRKDSPMTWTSSKFRKAVLAQLAFGPLITMGIYIKVVGLSGNIFPTTVAA